MQRRSQSMQHCPNPHMKALTSEKTILQEKLEIAHKKIDFRAQTREFWDGGSKFCKFADCTVTCPNSVWRPYACMYPMLVYMSLQMRTCLNNCLPKCLIDKNKHAYAHAGTCLDICLYACLDTCLDTCLDICLESYPGRGG